MAFFAADRVKVSTTTTGTADFGLGSAVSAAFQSFVAAGVPNGATVHYSAFLSNAFECGEGVYDSGAAELSRDTIFASSNSGAKVNFVSSPTVIITWLAATFGELARTKLTGDTTFYVATTGSDSTGDGTFGNPWATAYKAYTYILEHIDFAGHAITIQLADGTYTLPGYGFHFYAPQGLVGAGSMGSILIQGNVGDHTAVVIDNAGGNAPAFNLQGHVSIVFDGLTIKNDDSGQAAINCQGPEVWCGLRTVGFEDCGNCIYVAYRGTMSTGPASSLHFTGSFEQICYIENPGAMFDNNGGVSYTFHSTPTFSDCLFECFEGGIIYFGDVNVSGSASGKVARIHGGIFKSDSFDFTTLGNGIIETSPTGTYNLTSLSGIGYATPGVGLDPKSGGTVTQSSNKSTTVELNKPTGQITMHNATLNSDTTVTFTLTNSRIENTDLLILNHKSGGTAGAYALNAQCGFGGASINVRNITGGNLGEAIVISFALVKGATS